MSCSDQEGGTHHFGCDCREVYVRHLEAVVKAADNIPHHCQIPCPLCESLAALKGPQLK